MVITGPDLTKAPPRSPRVRLGGYVILPRMLDKGRATIAGKNGAYQFSCPLDRRFFDFTGISPNSLMNQLATGKSDELVLTWIRKSAPKQRTQSEIEFWSETESRYAPADVESRKFFNSLQEQVAPTRNDIMTWFDLLDVDDYVTFGAKA
ncbi:MAG: hypothetical protein M2R45_01600 [Verrucomicrobia subdivision 3 bacterium]|nr:hypothetical protein [Limisphaerales bacterium]MCS1412752.1 hypothetical protein [Limisphaerales bacterium]